MSDLKKTIVIIFIFATSMLLLFIGFNRLIPRPEPPLDGKADVWIYPENDNSNPIWGIKNGIIFGIDVTEMDYKPATLWAKGLLRIGWADEDGKSHFFNYIGLSIFKDGRKMDFSEIERINFHPDNIDYAATLQDLLSEYPENSIEVQDLLSLESNPPTLLSQVTTFEDNRMSVLLRLTTFRVSQAKIYLIIVIDQDKPREIQISIYNQEENTNPLDYVILSATYGNLARLRELYLKSQTVNANSLFQGQEQGSWCFYPIMSFGLNDLLTDDQGTITVYAGNDEEGDWIADLGNGAPYYNGPKFYQYWRKYPDTYREDLQVRVNGREKYFAGFLNPCGSKNITGGISFENFEMIEEYYLGQTFWFGFEYALEY